MCMRAPIAVGAVVCAQKKRCGVSRALLKT